MGSADLTTQILTDIRDEIRGTRTDQLAFREEMLAFREEMEARFARADQRFEVIETAIRDLAQQLVILGRGVKEAIEERGRTRDRLDEHEQRIRTIEGKLAG